MKHDRFIFLDGMRGIAALAVMIMHFTLYTNYPIFSSAYVAVDLFFVLSGFVIARSYIDKLDNGEALTSLVAKRIIRFLPTYMIGMLLGLCAILLNKFYKGWDLSYQEILSSFILNLVFVPFENSHLSVLGNGLYPQTGITFPLNPPAWSLAFELYVNIVFFITVKFHLITKNLNLKSACTILLVSVVSLLLNSHAFGLGWASGLKQFAYGSIRVISGFYIGYLLFTLPKLGPKRIALPLSIALIICFCLPSDRITYAILIALMPLFVYFGSSVITSGASDRLFSWIGNLSYPIYCLHYPFLFLLNVFCDFKANYMPYVLIGICAFVIVLSHLIYYYFDEPVRKFLVRRLFTKSTNATRAEIGFPPAL